MNLSRRNLHAGGFTLVEILVAMGVFGLVMAAIYSTWSAVMNASLSCNRVTAQIQRERIAARVMEEALTCTHAFASDIKYYGFAFENGPKPFLSFAARLPKSFPRSGRFGDFDMRRVTFSVENGRLLLHQNPILMEMDEDEERYPLELARNVKSFEIQAMDPRNGNWADTWTQTNVMPKMINVTVTFEDPENKGAGAKKAEGFNRVVALPSVTVQASWQRPTLRRGGNPPAGGPAIGAQ